MKLAIMQPYAFPYIGYFQLINTVDKFVIYDDVSYINRGWINRNNILVNKKNYLFTIPLKEASQNKLINEIKVVEGNSWKNSLLKSIELSYKKAPFYKGIYELINRIILSPCIHIHELVSLSIISISKYLEFKTEFVLTSSIYKNSNLKGQDRILDICLIERANTYINPVGGIAIYSRGKFIDAGININFLKTNLIEYRQFDNEFVPNLSIIDVLMFNDVEKIKELLLQFILI
jgi:WbqC-like protein family